LGEGWRVAVTTLMYERRGAALQRARFASPTGRTVREAVAESDEYFATYSWYPQRAGRADLVADAARAAGVAADALVRQKIVSVPAVSIAGGTDEIQRNIIGERVLGLPKEPAVDRDLPFRDIPRNSRQ